MKNLEIVVDRFNNIVYYSNIHNSMIDLSQLEGFEWDQGNFMKNWLKHEVGYKECEEVFDDERLNIFYDSKHSGSEKRFAAFGQTKAGRLLTIIFTIRNNQIRIISARNQSRKERKEYEKNKNNSKI